MNHEVDTAEDPGAEDDTDVVEARTVLAELTREPGTDVAVLEVDGRRLEGPVTGRGRDFQGVFEGETVAERSASVEDEPSGYSYATSTRSAVTDVVYLRVRGDALSGDWETRRSDLGRYTESDAWDAATYGSNEGQIPVSDWLFVRWNQPVLPNLGDVDDCEGAMCELTLRPCEQVRASFTGGP